MSAVQSHYDPALVAEIKFLSQQVDESLQESQIAREAFEKLQSQSFNASVTKEVAASVRHAQFLKCANVAIIGFSLFILCINTIYGFKHTIKSL